MKFALKKENLTFLLAIAAQSVALAQITDLAKAPLFTTQSTPVKPNLLYVLDDSGSMAWTYLPDEAGNFGNGGGGGGGGGNTGTYGEMSYQCNGLSYNPALTYAPPVNSSGQSFPNASFSAAWSDGFIANATTMGTAPSKGGGATTTVDLTGASYYAYSGSQPAMSYTYTAAGVITSTTFYKECASLVGSAPGSGVFNQVVMSAASSDAQNYANWYAYYRTRMLLTKSAVGLAFQSLDANYRVGFANIHSTLPILDVKDFDSTQKSLFFTNLYATQPGSSTPLRGAFSRAGQYYANLAPNQKYDPIQYSCQRNFTLLSTDGYWNTGDESSGGGSSSNFGPYKLDNTTTVDQQDGLGTARPYFDGWEQRITTVTTYQTVDTTVKTTVTPRTITTSTTTSQTVTTFPSSKHQTITTSASNTSTYPQQSASLSKPTGKTNVTVTATLANHGYSVGDQLYFTMPSGFTTGYYTVTSTPTLNTFTFTESFGSNGVASGTATVQKVNAGTCPAGTAYQSVQTQGRDNTSTATTTQKTSSIDSYVDTTVVTSYLTTTFTTTSVILNGTQLAPTSTQTTANTPASSTVTSTTGPTNSVVVNNPVTGNATNSNTGVWVNIGAPVVGSTCVSILASPQTASVSGTFAATGTNNTITVNNPDTVSGPTSKNGTSSVTSSITPGAPTTPTTTVTTSVTGGANNSLADVTMYYYMTDLRDPSLNNCKGSLKTDVCSNNVNATSTDTATWQHMTTFTLGLGAGGTLAYDPNYLKQKSGDYISILQGTKNWPMPAADTATAIDDLWHAAVNGRGQYFSAKDPVSLSNAFSGTISSIQAITGTASAAATSTLQPVQGDNDIFVAQFTSLKWTGDILKYSIDPSSGLISTTPGWSAQAQLEKVAPGSRKIYFKSASSLVEFNSANVAASGIDSYFANFCSKTAASGVGKPTQCSALSSSDLVSANTSANLITYLRGDQSLSYYRSREKVLGDVINASPVFVGKPHYSYTAGGYPSYVSANSGRQGVIYAAANDGMLHAFSQTDGSELWAFIPTPMLAKLYKLADAGYSTNHDYYVDGTPTTGDVYFGNSWHTILVGGYSGGGSGYYALDVTDPTSPSILWEFTEADMGYTYGSPVITKRSDGTWVVAVTSGYNNVAGDGNGHLYILNAGSGAQLMKLDTMLSSSTPAGTKSKPSGLNGINAWIESDTDNTAKRFYGGDLLGHIWRFDIDSNTAPHKSAMLFATLTSGNVAQPITTAPALAMVTSSGGASYPVVYVATGEYLGSTDLTSTAQQSVYAIKDPLTTSGYGNIRSASPGLVVQTSSSATSSSGAQIQVSNGTTVDWANKAGWVYDFPNAGERTNVNPSIVMNTMFVATNVPSSSACAVGGSSYEYQFDIGSGMAPSTATDKALSVYMGSTLIVGLTNVQLSNSGTNPGTVVTITTKSDGNLQTTSSGANSSSVQLRRTSWREIN